MLCTCNLILFHFFIITGWLDFRTISQIQLLSLLPFFPLLLPLYSTTNGSCFVSIKYGRVESRGGEYEEFVGVHFEVGERIWMRDPHMVEIGGQKKGFGWRCSYSYQNTWKFWTMTVYFLFEYIFYPRRGKFIPR